MWRWFDQQGLRPDDVVPPAKLLADFRSWLTYRGAIAARLLHILTDHDVAEVLTEILAAELRSWDGTVRDRHGHRSLHGLVVWDAWTDRFSAALRATADLAGARVDDGYGCRTLDEHDDLVLVDVEDEGATLLGRGSSVRLSSELVLRVGGDPGYLFAEDDTVAGLVQQRAPALGFPYRALIRNDTVSRATEAFEAAGAGRLASRAGPIPGWSVLEPVRMFRAVEDPSLAGLGSITPRPPTRLELSGGLRIGGRTWMAAGPPDVIVPLDQGPRQLVVNGRNAMTLPMSIPPVSLRQLVTDPGEHEVAVSGQRTRLRLVRAVHEFPSPCDYGYTVENVDGTCRVGPFAAAARTESAVRGALVCGGAAEEDFPLARTLGSVETFVLTDQGRCVQVDIRRPRWLADIDLDVHYVEVMQAAGGLDGTPAFFLHRNRPGQPLHVLEILRTANGPSREVAERPDILAELVEQLALDQVVEEGSVDSRRLRRTAWAAVGRGPGYRRSGPLRGIPTGPRSSAARIPGLRDHVAGRHDHVLAWASELEGGEADTGRFRETWEWLCRRDRRVDEANRSMLVLYNLEVLGHVEQDRCRRRFGVAPGVANVLAGGGGYALLCGARPPRLLERLRESDRDADPRVRQAGVHWDVHLRDQRDGEGGEGHTIGPSAAYLEWDPDHHDKALEGLRALGVQVVFRAGDRLLDLLVSLRIILETAPALTMSPSARFERWESSGGRHAWASKTEDRTPGLYRYPCWGGPMLAWRNQPDAALRVVDKRVGYYLQHARDGRTDLLHHDPFEHRLVAPRSAPLPPLIARAIVLRSGLLPQLLHGFRPNRMGAPQDVFVYRNVDRDTAGRVARLLGQSIQPLGQRIEECR